MFRFIITANKRRANRKALAAWNKGHEARQRKGTNHLGDTVVRAIPVVGNWR